MCAKFGTFIQKSFVLFCGCICWYNVCCCGSLLNWLKADTAKSLKRSGLTSFLVTFSEFRLSCFANGSVTEMRGVSEKDLKASYLEVTLGDVERGVMPKKLLSDRVWAGNSGIEVWRKGFDTEWVRVFVSGNTGLWLRIWLNWLEMSVRVERSSRTEDDLNEPENPWESREVSNDKGSEVTGACKYQWKEKVKNV